MDLTIKNKLDKITTFLLDMDGTIYLGNQLFEGVIETLELMRKRGRIVFLTNNSSKSQVAYINKLHKLGIEAQASEVYTSGMATISYLKRHYPNKSVYCLGTEALKEECLKEGLILKDDADVAFLGYDTELTYEKLCKFTNLLHEGKPYIASHPDFNCPAAPYYVPDIGSFMAMIEASTGRKPDVVIGKPYTEMGQSIMDTFSVDASEVCMIGDRLYTDIAFGNNNHFTSICVFSGETSHEDYEQSAVKADICLEHIKDIREYLA